MKENVHAKIPKVCSLKRSPIVSPSKNISFILHRENGESDNEQRCERRE